MPWFIHMKEHSVDIRKKNSVLVCIDKEPLPGERSKVHKRIQKGRTNVYNTLTLVFFKTRLLFLNIHTRTYKHMC